jgi:hypothetical protein
MSNMGQAVAWECCLWASHENVSVELPDAAWLQQAPSGSFDSPLGSLRSLGVRSG